MKKITVLLWVLTLLAVNTARSQGPDKQLNIQLSHHKIVNVDGKETRVSGSSAKPGEVIEYTAVCKNTGKTLVKDVQPELPVPVGMEYLPGTSSSPEVMGSINDKEFAKLPLKRKVKNPAGQMVEEDVPMSEVRFLRWNLGEIAGGASKTVSARMRLALLPGTIDNKR